MSACCVDSVKSVALLCRGFLAPCLPPELDLLDGFSDLLGDLTCVKSALLSLRVVLFLPLLATLLATDDSAGFEALFSPPVFRGCFVSRAFLSLAGCFLGDTLPDLLAFAGGFAAGRCMLVSVLGGRLGAGRLSLAARGVACCGSDDA